MVIAAVGVIVWVAIAFVVVIGGSIVLGRWLQRKGRDMEKGPPD